jgi:hypothetical protein
LSEEFGSNLDEKMGMEWDGVVDVHGVPAALMDEGGDHDVVREVTIDLDQEREVKQDVGVDVEREIDVLIDAGPRTRARPVLTHLLTSKAIARTVLPHNDDKAQLLASPYTTRFPSSSSTYSSSPTRASASATGIVTANALSPSHDNVTIRHEVGLGVRPSLKKIAARRRSSLGPGRLMQLRAEAEALSSVRLAKEIDNAANMEGESTARAQRRASTLGMKHNSADSLGYFDCRPVMMRHEGAGEVAVTHGV